MNDIDCENVRVAAMAIADGEEASLDAKGIELHLLQCEACREEIEQLGATSQLLSSQKRFKEPVDVWPVVSERIELLTESKQLFRWRVLLLCAIPLFGYKFFTLLLDAAPSLWSRLIPVILMIVI